MATRAVNRLVLCGLNLHHQWRWHSTEDGRRYRRCFRCGKDDDDRDMRVTSSSFVVRF